MLEEQSLLLATSHEVREHLRESRREQGERHERAGERDTHTERDRETKRQRETKTETDSVHVCVCVGEWLTAGYMRLLMPSSGLIALPHLLLRPVRWEEKSAEGSTRPALTVRRGVPVRR